jgi:transcription-repair coupling factor (superfamily II helicase)
MIFFESLDETNAENIRKQYNTICLCTKVLLMKKTKLPATRITRFFERYHKNLNKTAIRKTEYYFKRIDNVVVEIM